jgi:predicted membrane chloride channel (bestrophin family)
MLLYIIFMPIVLWSKLHWGTFFVAPVITFALAGVPHLLFLFQRLQLNQNEKI